MFFVMQVEGFERKCLALFAKDYKYSVSCLALFYRDPDPFNTSEGLVGVVGRWMNHDEQYKG